MSSETRGQIVFFIFSLNGGGAAKILLRLANRYAKDKNILILTLEEVTGIYEIPHEVTVQIVKTSKNGIFPSSVNFYLSLFRSLRFTLKKVNPKKVISFIHVANIMTILSTIGQGCDVFVCERSDILKTKIHPFWKQIRPYIYFMADHVIVQNNSDSYKFPRFLRHLILTASNPMLAAIQPITKNSKRLVSVGRLHRVKRYELIIQTIAPLLHKNPDLEYWIFGEGEMRDSITRQISELMLKDQIKLKGHHDKVEGIIGESSVFLMASESEGQPNSMIEAAIHGVPTVCFATSQCFYEIADFFPNVHIIEEGKKEIYLETISILINQPAAKPSFEEMSEQLEKWNAKSYAQWDKIIL